MGRKYVYRRFVRDENGKEHIRIIAFDRKPKKHIVEHAFAHTDWEKVSEETKKREEEQRRRDEIFWKRMDYVFWSVIAIIIVIALFFTCRYFF